jgi:hypothetical protein
VYLYVLKIFKALIPCNTCYNSYKISRLFGICFKHEFDKYKHRCLLQYKYLTKKNPPLAACMGSGLQVKRPGWSLCDQSII